MPILAAAFVGNCIGFIVAILVLSLDMAIKDIEEAENIDLFLAVLVWVLVATIVYHWLR